MTKIQSQCLQVFLNQYAFQHEQEMFTLYILLIWMNLYYLTNVNMKTANKYKTFTETYHFLNQSLVDEHIAVAPVLERKLKLQARLNMWQMKI